MEVVCLVSGVVLTGCSVNLACGGGVQRHASGWGLRAFYRQLREFCLWVGAWAPVAALTRLDSWQALCDEVVERMAERGVHMGRGEACALVLLVSCCASGLLCLSARHWLGRVVGMGALVVGVPVWDSARRRARARALIDEMPEVFRTLAMALGSGETLSQAIEYVGVHERGYAGRAFAHTALRLRCGASTEEAMEALAGELDAPGVGLLTTALVIAQRTGSPLRGLFQSSAQLVERQGEYERMLAVKTAQVRLSVRIVCLLPLVLVALLSLISVDFQKGVATLPGTLSVLAAALMDGCALLIIRRLMRGVL